MLQSVAQSPARRGTARRLSRGPVLSGRGRAENRRGGGMPAKLASDRSNGLDMPFPELVGSLLWHRTVTSLDRFQHAMVAIRACLELPMQIWVLNVYDLVYIIITALNVTH